MTKRRPFSRFATLAVPVAAMALLAGCGDGDSSTTDHEEAEAVATPRKAIAEITAVRVGLGAGFNAYLAGDSEKAQELIGDAYIEHFELVEPSLEERDEELNEELELLLSNEIRAEMKKDAGVAKVKALVAEADRELTEAEKALEG